jgi:hypothetical protein
MPQPIHVWYGDGDHNPLGPIEAELLETLPNGDARFRITDPDWLRHVGWDEPVEFTYGRLLGSRYVHYDAYAWCPVGEGGEGDPWWRQP